MTEYEAFLPYVLPDAPGCPEVVAIQAIRNAAIEFCEKSLVIVRDHEPITVVTGVVDYDLEPPTDMLVTKVMQAWMENNPIEPMFPDIVREAAVYNRLFSSYNSAPSRPTSYLQKDERTISIWPRPDKKYVNGLTLRVALKPTRSSDSVEDVVFEDYAEVVAAGALSKLMMSNNRPFTNLPLSTARRNEFLIGMNTARSRSVHGHTRSNLSVRMRRI